MYFFIKQNIIPNISWVKYNPAMFFKSIIIFFNNFFFLTRITNFDILH